MPQPSQKFLRMTDLASQNAPRISTRRSGANSRDFSSNALSNTRAPPQVKWSDMFPSAFYKVSTSVRRLPKNLLSNRLWIVLGRQLYIRVSLSRSQSRLKRLSGELTLDSSTPLYLRWSRYFGKHIEQSNSALLVNELGMFGNMTRRLATALLVAKSLNLRAVIIPKSAIFQTGIYVEAKHELRSGPTIFFGTQPYLNAEKPISLVVPDVFFTYEPDTQARHELVLQCWTELRSMLWNQGIVPQYADSDLVIHIRGGDVFGPRSPRKYGQPPFAFYELVLRSRDWSRVILVVEDQSNPVAPEIEVLCRKLEIPVILFSGTLREVLTVLLGAINLTAGRGTFIPAVAGLSANCANLYFFEDKCSISPGLNRVKMHRVYDQSGYFRAGVLTGNWENSAEQRALMLNYPSSALAFETAVSASS